MASHLSLLQPVLAAGRALHGWLLRAACLVTWPFRQLYKKAFGYDVFISYARQDALPYAQGLEAALGPTFICYRDEGDASHGRPLSEIIEHGVLRSRSLVVVVTPGACGSPWVADELAAFSKRLETGRHSKSRPHIFPIFVHPCTPENLPPPLACLKQHLGCKESNQEIPSRETLLRVRGAFPGLSKAARLYGAFLVGMVVVGAVLTAFALARMAGARRNWLEAAARAEAAGRMDRAELLVAKAVESDPFAHAEDAELYARLRARRMLTPAGCRPLPESGSARLLIASGGGLRMLLEDTESHWLELHSLTSAGPVVQLLDTGDHISHAVLAGQEVWAAAGDRLAMKNVEEGAAVPVQTLQLPGNCHALRATDAGMHVLCETRSGASADAEAGASLLLVTRKGGKLHAEAVALQGTLPAADRMCLLGGRADTAVCAIDGGLRLTVQFWSRKGTELPSQSWLHPARYVESPEVVHQGRYLIFSSMEDFPGLDPRKEPQTFALDLLYPPGGVGGRTVQLVSQSYVEVKSLERSVAFAAALGVGRELRFWENLNPPVLNQGSISVTGGMRSFEPWEAPADTPYYTADAAVVLVAKDSALEVYAEHYEPGVRAGDAIVSRVAQYPLAAGFETGHILVSQDGEYVGITQWRNEGERICNQMTLLRRAGPAPTAVATVPHSGELANALGLDAALAETLQPPPTLAPPSAPPQP